MKGPTVPTETPIRQPAAPASADATANTVTSTRRTFMPSRRAISGFSSTTRTARPERVRVIQKCRMSIRMSEITNVTT